MRRWLLCMQKDRPRQRSQDRRILKDDRQVTKQPDPLRCQGGIDEIVKDSKDPNEAELREQFVHIRTGEKQARVTMSKQMPQGLAEAPHYIPGIAFIEQDTPTVSQQLED